MQTRIRIRPSVLGTKALLLFCLLEVAFLATDYSNLFFLLLAFSAIVGVLGAFWSYRNVRGLNIAAVTTRPAPTQESRALRVDVTADGHRPRFGIAVRLPGLSSEEVAYEHLVTGNTPVESQLPPLPRGRIELDRVELVSHYPFGLFVASARLPAATELLTYPQPAPLHAERSLGNADAGDQLGGSSRGSTLAGLRAFRTGDPVSDVHWKATARRGRAIVKEREPESDRQTIVRLDRRCEPERFERALSQVTSLVLDARHGHPLRLVSQECELEIDPERGGGEQALRFLAAAMPLPMDAPEPPVVHGAIALPERGRS